MKKTGIWFAIAIVVIVIDQVTKVWAESVLIDGNVIVVTSFFKFQLAYNTGAAFSFLGDAGGWQRWLFAVIAFVVSIGIAIWIKKLATSAKTDRYWELLALSLILGGAIGNLYDRVLLGHVIDFIVWHYEQHYWPTFNIADSAICAGAALLVFDMLFIQDHKTEDEKTN
ncbi:MAG: signal peptidase II [Cellvibrionaceae bacterium]